MEVCATEFEALRSSCLRTERNILGLNLALRACAVAWARGGAVVKAQQPYSIRSPFCPALQLCFATTNALSLTLDFGTALALDQGIIAGTSSASEACLMQIVRK